jgi:hypothetical protein
MQMRLFDYGFVKTYPEKMSARADPNIAVAVPPNRA